MSIGPKRQSGFEEPKSPWLSVSIEHLNGLKTLNLKNVKTYLIHLLRTLILCHGSQQLSERFFGFGLSLPDFGDSCFVVINYDGY